MGTGYCPLTSQKKLFDFVNNMKDIKKKSVGNIHTNDRYNMKAMSEIIQR